MFERLTRHQRLNIICQIAIAQYLNMKMILPKTICIPKQHTSTFFFPTSSSRRSVLTESILNTHLLKKHLNIVSTQSTDLLSSNLIVQYNIKNIPVLKNNSYRYWYDLCRSKVYNKTEISKIFRKYQYPQYLIDISNKIIKQIQQRSPYTSIHVRRGDKVNKKLNYCTHPEMIRKKLNFMNITNGTIYIATNEYKSNYFTQLNQWYNVYTIKDFESLIFDKATKQNSYALLIIDELVINNSKIKISTFKEPNVDAFLCS
ncbi:unnamed protein product [Didymodactylos carnosus]|uniref:Uncharacterized protein n=1 Tax=Didymodactylos carnosus TaxID=1234261 RepID=A0A814U7Q9_9BILA|nr:unnamed protein product [Didymodactylos carnosus]CAF3934763.1 unnamed protein product [Didymodactylos carnosus]